MSPDHGVFDRNALPRSRPISEDHAHHPAPHLLVAVHRLQQRFDGRIDLEGWQRVDDAELQNGDEVRIGKFRLIFFASDAQDS